MNSTKKLFAGFLAASALGAGLALAGYKLFVEEKTYQTFEQKQSAVFARYSADSGHTKVPAGLDFTYAAEIVRPAVVHIKSIYENDPQQQGIGRNFNPHGNDPFFHFFFGEPDGGQNGQSPFGGGGAPREASGSGVILSEDGYIATNNHVIEKASKIEVVLDDKRKYIAKLVGRDPETDLALLKIEEKGLHFVKYGNSDAIRVGEWVIACGNPFDLTSTITAGIVSAKGRNINLLRTKENYAIESFIQTDAAVNPGNSGGALVDLNGDLIGINTAIATPTGTFAGYSFAVPATIVKKVMNDLLNFGEVQRALLGIMIQDVTADLAKEKNIKEIKGVYVNGVNEGSAAKDAGILANDVILKIDEIEVHSASELQEAVARHRPGEKVKVTLLRENKPKQLVVTLKNKRGTTTIVKEASAQMFEDLGAELQEVSKEDKEKMKINKGLQVKKLSQGKLKEAGVKEGFIITRIDKTEVTDTKELARMLQNKTGGILIEGIYPGGQSAYYAIGW